MFSEIAKAFVHVSEYLDAGAAEGTVSNRDTIVKMMRATFSRENNLKCIDKFHLSVGNKGTKSKLFTRSVSRGKL
jgi:hypothetical protein